MYHIMNWLRILIVYACCFLLSLNKVTWLDLTKLLCSTWRIRTLIPVPPACQAGALPFKLIPHCSKHILFNAMSLLLSSLRAWNHASCIEQSKVSILIQTAGNCRIVRHGTSKWSERSLVRLSAALNACLCIRFARAVTERGRRRDRGVWRFHDAF